MGQRAGEIIVPKPLKEAQLIEQYLESLGEGRKVRIFMPQKGEKRALLDLARRDVVEMTKTLEVKAATAREKEEAVRGAIAKLLGETEPKEAYRVESYDISNTNGVDTVGAMVVFRNQKPVKKDYRRFKIRTVEGPGRLRQSAGNALPQISQSQRRRSGFQYAAGSDSDGRRTGTGHRRREGPDCDAAGDSGAGYGEG